MNPGLEGADDVGARETGTISSPWCGTRRSTGRSSDHGITGRKPLAVHE
jgi:hypothetical protein